MGLSVVVGVGVVVGVLMLFSQLVDKQKHEALRNFFLIISIPLLFIIPASLVIEQNNCSSVVMNQTTAGNVTTFEYGTYCYEQPNGSRALLLSFSTIVFLFIFYVFVRFFGDLLSWLQKIVKKL